MAKINGIACCASAVFLVSTITGRKVTPRHIAAMIILSVCKLL